MQDAPKKLAFLFNICYIYFVSVRSNSHLS